LEDFGTSGGVAVFPCHAVDWQQHWKPTFCHRIAA